MRRTTSRWTCALVVLAGCGADDGAAPPSDAGPPCTVSLMYLPSLPIAGPRTAIHVTSDVGPTPGVLAYHWHVAFNGTTVAFAPLDEDHTGIELLATVPGIYDVSLDVTGSPMACSKSIAVNVGARDPLHERLRVKIVPPNASSAPAFVKTLVIDGGASVDLGVIPVDPGTPVMTTVRTAAGGVPAYVRFTPMAAPDAIVEAFSDAAGRVDTRLALGNHTVLVIPSTADAPGRIANWSSTAAALLLAAGTPITGVVRDPANAAIQGATVQLSIDGVPSTVAVTAANGNFAVHAQAGGGVVTVDVIPPASSGLPRLTASSASLDLKMPLQIRYQPTLVRRNLAGMQVVRQGVPLVGATVMIVGTLPAGAITAGSGAPVSATGDVRIAATTGGSGALPSTMVPAAALSAVVTVAPDDLAVTALDTTGSLPATLDALPAQSVTTAAAAPTGALPGAVLDIVPMGALAMAGAPALHLTADPAGAMKAVLAAGGHYELRFRDPLGRGAPLVLADVDATAVAPSYLLPTALQIRGMAMSGTQPLINAAVQILCEDCSGIQRTKPMAETTTDGGGRFVVAVPDPGTM